MPTCPTCNEPTVSVLSKLWSDKCSPVRCSACGSLSYLQSRSTIGLNLLLFPGILVSLFIWAWTDSLIAIAAFAGLVLFELCRVTFKSPMVPIAEDQVSENRRYGNLFLFIFLGTAATVWWLLS